MHHLRLQQKYAMVVCFVCTVSVITRTALAVESPRQCQEAPEVVRFPDPLGKWVGGTNALRADNLTSEASSTEKMACTPLCVIHFWILQHVRGKSGQTGGAKVDKLAVQLDLL